MRRGCLVLVVLGIFSVCPASAQAVTIGFDDMTTGLKSSDFLAAYGIPTVSWGGSAGAGGPYVSDFTGAPVLSPSMPNVLGQTWTEIDYGQPHWLSFDFSPALSSFSLTRIGTIFGGSTDVWQARFYGPSDEFLGSFGDAEPLIDPPDTQYTFDAPEGTTITRMVLESTYTGFATYRNIPVDDFVLVQVPEPATLTLLLTCGVGLLRRRSRAI